MAKERYDKGAVRDTILIGDQLELRFPIEIAEGERVVFEPTPNPIVAGVEVISQPKLDTVRSGKGKLELEGRVIITSFDSGTYTLPSFVAYKIREGGGVDTLSFDGGVLNVKTIEIDTTTYQPYDIKGQMGYPITFKEALSWSALGALLVLFVTLLYRFIKRRRERDAREEALLREPPHIVALRGLEKLEELELWRSDQKLYFSDMTELLRGYIEYRYNFGALEMTSAEIVERLRGEIERGEREELDSLFRLADLVKFAKYSAQEGECRATLPLAKKFIERGHESEMALKNEEKSGGEKEKSSSKEEVE